MNSLRGLRVALLATAMAVVASPSRAQPTTQPAESPDSPPPASEPQPADIEQPSEPGIERASEPASVAPAAASSTTSMPASPVAPSSQAPSAAEAASAALPPEPGPEASVKERQAYWDAAPLGPAVPPRGLQRKPPLTEHDRRSKRTQKPFSVIGVPQLGGNPDFGFILGAVTALTWYGDPKKEPFYDYSAYKQQIIAQAQVGLRKKPGVLGRQNYILRYAAPYINRSLFSFVADASFEADSAAQYFGVNAKTMGSLSSIGPKDARFDKHFDSYNDYQSELREVYTDAASGEALSYATYHNYKMQTPRLMSSLKVDLLGGIFTPAATLNVAYVDIDRYGGDRVRGTEGTALSPATKLDEDCKAGIAKHCSGGWNNTIKLSVALDTRDFPVDANQGVLLDVSAELASKVIGSVADYQRYTTSAAGFYNPFLAAGINTRWTQLVLAGRVLYSVQNGDVPFYAKNQLSFIDRNVGGLGGINSMRGYRLNRFVGNVMALGNFEVRYDVYSFNTKRSTIAFKLVPFVDTGRVWDKVAQTSFDGFRYDVGAGIQLQWNQTNVIRGDIGVGDEGMSFGVNYGMMF